MPTKTTADRDTRRLTAVLVANGVLRVAGAADGALIGFYLAHLAVEGRAVGAALVGLLGVMASGAELMGAVPAGTLADRHPPRRLLVLGALAGAVATQLFGMSGLLPVFFLSRALEGLAAATSGPPLLVHLADVTRRDRPARGRVMSFFELTLLAGVALGGLAGGTLWEAIRTAAFSALAGLYLLAAGLFYWGAHLPETHRAPSVHPMAGLARAFTDPLLLRLAPAWLAVNAILGLWLTHTAFQLTGPRVAGQSLVGAFTASEVGWILLGYALVFAAGVTAWGFLLASIPRVRALRVALGAMFSACLWLFVLNSVAVWSPLARAVALALLGLSVLVESGFTPAALAFLADVADQGEGRGAAMGVYTLLLGLGNVVGAGLGGVLAQWQALNGLLLGTVGLAAVALAALALLSSVQGTRPSGI